MAHMAMSTGALEAFCSTIFCLVPFETTPKKIPKQQVDTLYSWSHNSNACHLATNSNTEPPQMCLVDMNPQMLSAYVQGPHPVCLLGHPLLGESLQWLRIIP